MNHRPMQIIHDFRILGKQTGDVGTGLRALQAQGIGGVVTNMPFDDYMQDEGTWKAFREFLNVCRALGMRVWLYDEKGYPSGFAGGQVLARRPELEAVGLYRDETGRITEAPSYEGTHNCNNYFARARTPNLLEPEAVREFVRLTHERYATELGTDLAIVEAFFTDEPALNVMYFPPIPAAKDVPVMDPPDPHRRLLPGVPWSETLAAQYERRDLTGLFCDQAGASALRRDFYGRVGEQLAANYFGQIQTWCRAHRILSSGHMLWEEDPEIHVPLYGNFLRCLLRLDIPGIDVLSASPLSGYRYGRRAAVLAASAAMLNGTRRIFTESSDFEEQWNEKRMVTVGEATASLGWQAALGVTDFTFYFSYGLCPELSDRTFACLPEDQRKLARTPADYLAINNAINGWMEILGSASLAADVFLYYPIEPLQAAYYPVLRPWEAGSQSPELLRIAGAFTSALAGLLDAGIIPCLVDGAMLREIRRSTGTGAGYAVRKASANAIVCPAGCEPPQDCLPAEGCDIVPMTAELPRRLFEQGRARILNDNPEVCAGVMQDGARPLIILVNLTNREQSCRIRSKDGERQVKLAAYAVSLER